ncbi:MAG: HisA/HisF family protein [Archaeoglobales archaeon]|nr:MAG: HisA/HisF family protein [Archaeoglobales archaeon]
MKLYFVMDLLDGEVVGAVKGEREKYEPVHLTSKVVESSNPFQVFDVLRPKRLYVADLDAILGKGNNFAVIEKLAGMCELIADCGFKSVEEAKKVSFTPVLGSETFNLRKLEDGFYVSLDVRDEFLDASHSFASVDEAIEWLNSFRLKGVIVLSLRRVGTLQPDFELVERVVSASSNPVLAGGGIRNMEDVEKAKEIGCEGVLVATAVHKGLIPVEAIKNG